MRRLLLAGLVFSMLACSCKAHGTEKPNVVFETTLGTIVIKPNYDKAPISTKNFVGYVQRGFYDGVIFHRVIPRFMLQGGGYTKDLQKKPVGSPIENEGTNGLKNKRGTLSMARTSDPNSATSQFFVNLVDNAYLDTAANRPGYCVFAEVVSGMDVVDKIGAVKTQCPSKPRGPCTAHLPPGMRDVPVEPVIITKAYTK